MSVLNLIVNGQSHEVDVDPNMPILWVLRDYLKLVGTKYGCGIAQCGSCTIHLNGVAVRSCSMPISTALGQNITTIEGLSETGEHPVQLAWKKHDVPQCGYCQAGQVMTAIAFLDKNPKPSDEEIDIALQGNLCRCGTYNRIKSAIKTASKAL